MKNSQHQKLVRTRSNQNSYVLWVGIYTGHALWKTGVFLKSYTYIYSVFLKTAIMLRLINPDPLHDPAIPRLDINPRVKKTYAHKYVLGCS